MMKTTLSTIMAVLMIAASFSVSAKKDKEKKVQEFTVKRTINVSADRVWAVVGEDFGAVANSHPQIVSSDYINGTLKSGEGAERVCNFNDKGTKYVKERQVNYDPENYTFQAQIFHAGKLPLDPEHSYGVYKVIPIDDQSCELVMDLGIRTKPAFMGAMAKGKFKKTIADYLLAVEHHVVTGEIVNQDNFKEIKKQYKDKS